MISVKENIHDFLMIRKMIKKVVVLLMIYRNHSVYVLYTNY